MAHLSYRVRQQNLEIIKYSQTPEIETANFFQCYASLNLSLAYCKFHKTSSTATKGKVNMRLMLESN